MTDKELRTKWLQLHRKPQYRETLRPEIKSSWERCYDRGVNPYLRENPYICTENEVAQSREACRQILKVGEPVMRDLYEFVAETGFVVGILDENLCAIDFIGDRESLAWAKRARLVVGSMWAEKLVGTNGATLCQDLGKPVSVFAYEHFCLFSHVSASSCAPIIDQGKIGGVLCMVAPFNRVSNHTLGMVDAASKHIMSKMVLHRINLYLKQIMESMAEGVLVLDSNGTITYMNDICARMLQISPRLAYGSNISAVLGYNADNSHFVNKVTQNRPILDENFKLVTLDNTTINCVVTCNPLSHPDIPPGDTVVIMRETQRVTRLVKKWIGDGAKFTFDDIVGKDSKFTQVLKTAQAAASSSSNALLLGESGTGKDLFAQAMHNGSMRRPHPYVALNCAALPRELIASELFGYDEGAFTGARKSGNMGKFELADQGTIFLDEIGDMPLDLQASLLRVIEEKSVTRLGGTKLIPVNVRIIAATNKDLEYEIKRNRFRRDLYYRLAVIKITMPPLRERRHDILLLAEVFIEKYCKRFNKPPMQMAPEVKEAFLEYAWPGNIREIQNVIEGAIQLAPGNIITYDLVNQYFVDQASVHEVEHHERIEETAGPDPGSEKQALMEYLTKYKYNKSDVAQAMGISRRTLYKRLKKYDLF